MSKLKNPWVNKGSYDKNNLKGGQYPWLIDTTLMIYLLHYLKHL